MRCGNNNPFPMNLCPGEFPTQRPVTRSLDVFFDLRLNKRLSKQPWGWWFETLSVWLWRQSNVLLLSEWVGMCRPLDPLFPTQVHSLVGSSNVKHTPTEYHFFVLSHSLCVILGKFSNLTTLLGSFLWKFYTMVGVNIHPMDTPVGVEIHTGR